MTAATKPLLHIPQPNPPSARSSTSIHTHTGVVYFAVKDNCWQVLSPELKTCPLSSSPIHERDAFVFFDESRCRGADMKLRDDAVALLTVGPGMCKDKIMQAAGRMRKLKHGQNLILGVPSELDLSIRAASHPQIAETAELLPSHLLQWVLQNTVKANEDGLSAWGTQGIHFATTRDPRVRCVDEEYRLEKLYASAVATEKVHAFLHSRKRLDLARVEKFPPRPQATRLLQKIMQKGDTYGQDVSVVTTSMDEECERELTAEREIMQEQEIEIPRHDPYDPYCAMKWFASVPLVTEPTQLPYYAEVTTLSSVITGRKRYPLEWGEINWDQFGIFVTQNFIETVVKDEAAGGGKVDDLRNFMRPVDTFVLWRSGKCLLVCEWEADQIIGELWKKSPSETNAMLVSLSYLRAASDNNWTQPPHLVTPRGSVFSSNLFRKAVDRLLVGLDLFAGHTTFGPRRQQLKTVLGTAKSKQVALQIPVIRGQSQLIARSDLDDACTL